jgi:ribosomal-protein-alanine N-acetyltransferase
MMQDARVQRYITGKAFTDEEALAGLERCHQLNNTYGLGYWLIYDSEQVCMGMCLLKPMPTDRETGYIETGYWIKPDFWGNKIAAEVSRRLIDYAFNDLDLDQITAVVDSENIASIKSLERAGLTRDGSIIAYASELPFFSITRHNYLNKKS